jgi:hypothetical protein
MFNDTLSITIINNTTTAQPWVAFSYNKGTQNVPGVFVSVSESSLQQSNRQSATVPFKVQSIKIKTQTEPQLSNPITIQVTDATGKLQQASLMPLDYYEPTNGIKNLVKINNPDITISGQVGLSGVINAGQTMNVIIQLKKTSGFSNFLNGIFTKISNKQFTVKWRLLPRITPFRG